MANVKEASLSQLEFDQQFGRHETESSWKKRAVNTARTRCRCTKPCFIEKLLGFIPLISVLRTYRWRYWLYKDIIAGLSVGVLQIPQGMGFAMLAGLAPVYGLYSSFWPVLIYGFFGTSRHISMGTMAITSLILAGPIESAASEYIPQNTTNASLDASQDPLLSRGSLEDEEQAIRAGTAAVITLLVGLFQIIFGLARFGSLTTFMSKSFTSGFTTGAGVHIGTSQIPGFFGIKITQVNGMFKIPKTWVNIFENISKTNLAAFVVGLICLIILLLIKEVINEKYKHKIKIPIPAELLVVIFATVASYFLKLNEKYQMAIVGTIPSGMSPPTLPPMENATHYIIDALVLAIISFVITVSMAELFSQKYRYPIDPNQEFIAYGLGHAVGSFFGCFAGATAPPRCFIQEQAGAKSLLANFVSCALILLVLFSIGHLFQHLPSAALAAIIIVALFPLFKQFKHPKEYWCLNKQDVLIWLVTFASVVFLNVDIGLGIGIAFSIFTVTLQSMFAKGSILGYIIPAGIYAPMEKYHSTINRNKVCVFKYESNIYFATIKNFKERLFAATGDPQEMLNQSKNENKVKGTEKVVDISVTYVNQIGEDKGLDNEGYQSEESKPDKTVNGLNGINSFAVDKAEDLGDLKLIVLDCSPVTYFDIMGLSLIKTLHSDYRLVGIQFALANCNPDNLKKLQAAGVVNSIGLESSEQKTGVPVYPSIHDAVSSLSGSEFGQPCTAESTVSPENIVTKL